MKTIYFIFIFFFITFNYANAQIVNIPDAAFKQYLVTEYDTSGDGEIQTGEALAVTYISVYSKGIFSMEGIKSFKNLKTLLCGGNPFTSLDLQGMTALTNLECGYSYMLNTLNVNGAINLVNLDCRQSKLTTLDLRGLSKLLTLNCGDNLLESLLISDAVNLTELQCPINKLTALDIRSLTNLKSVVCFNNLLTDLDVQGLSKLTSLDCNTNQLTSINLNGCFQLSDLNCSKNQLSNLNLQSCTGLQFLHCNDNQLTSLNVLNLPLLKELYCDENKLTTLTVKNLPHLYRISCADNLLTSLTVSNLQNLTDLICNSNQLTSIEVQDSFPYFQYLICGDNPLISLFLKNDTEGRPFTLNINNVTTLKYICCVDNRINYVQTVVNQAGLQTQCAVNSYCSFNPGGKYNTIKGVSTLALDNISCTNGNSPFSPLNYTVSDGGVTTTVFGNVEGEFATYTNVGTYTLTPKFENPEYFIASPSSKQFVFNNNNNNTQIQDFCITPNGLKNDLEVKFIPVNTVRPGFTTEFKLICKNKGNTVLSGAVTLNFDASKSQFISSDIIPDLQNAGTLIYNFSQLKSFESKIITVTLKTNAPPIVNVNDLLNYSATVTPVINDLTENDNTFNLQQMVVGSFDPNDKTCLEGSVLAPALIGKYVTYKIRFENTGTANAEQVVIKDVINTAMFDIKNIIPIASSHSYQTRLKGNVLEFIFENIDLPFDDENNDGYIVFKIKTLPSLVVGSQIKNKASIFFDYNLPIVTNEFSSVFQTLSTGDLALKKGDLQIFPNPVNDYLKFKTKYQIRSVEFFDLTGRILFKSAISESQIDVSLLKKGNYIVKFESDNGYFVKKIMKE